MPPTLDVLLDRLEAAKSCFGRGTAAEIKVLLDQLSGRNFRDAKSSSRFHEALLFLRAFPQSAALVLRIEELLNTFHERVEKLRELDDNLAVFDDFDTSGIAGTAMQDTLNFEVALAPPPPRAQRRDRMGGLRRRTRTRWERPGALHSSAGGRL